MRIISILILSLAAAVFSWVKPCGSWACDSAAYRQVLTEGGYSERETGRKILIATPGSGEDRITSIDIEVSFLSKQIGKLSALEYLYIDNSGLDSLPAEITQLSSLVLLSAAKNNLSKLPAGFDSLASLVKLSLSGNRFTSLPAAIPLLPVLGVLVMSENPLNSFPPGLLEMPNLDILDLSLCNIQTVPPEIAQMMHLEVLYLGQCGISVLPPEIWQLSRLQSLNLGRNAIQELPAGIEGQDSLWSLYLSDNLLTELPPEIGSVSNLIELSLSGNRLTSIPPEINRLKRLDRLDISRNLLTGLPIEFVQVLFFPRYVYVGYNRICSLPDSLEEWVESNSSDEVYWKDTQKMDEGRYCDGSGTDHLTPSVLTAPFTVITSPGGTSVSVYFHVSSDDRQVWIYDIHGKSVAAFENIPAHEEKVTWTHGAERRGVYIVRVRTAETVSAVRVVF